MTDTTTDGKGKFALNNTVYDVAKFVTTILLPALTTLYLTLAQIWNWPYTTEVALTSAAIVTFLGVVLGISTASYNNSLSKGKDGTIELDFSNPTKETVVTELKTPFIDVQGKKNIILKVVDKTSQ